ncbi:hypothetical protein D3C76_858950 [compost metagenome]
MAPRRFWLTAPDNLSEAPVAEIVLPAPDARSPTCPLAAAPVEVVLTALLLKLMTAPCSASAAVVLAAARLTVMPSPVICPSALLAFRPTALAGVTVITVPGATVQSVLLATAGVGQGPAAQAGAPMAPSSATVKSAQRKGWGIESGECKRCVMAASSLCEIPLLIPETTREPGRTQAKRLRPHGDVSIHV